MKKGIIFVVIIAIIIVGVMLFRNKGSNDTLTPPPPPPPTVKPPPSEGPPPPALNTGFHGTDLSKIPSNATVIKMTDKEFSPEKITVKKGVTVYFVNEGEKSHWPATNIHPTHRVYPDSDIKNCKSEKEAEMFDACRDIEKDNFYAFTFGEAGIWRFHDHLNASLSGSITVE